MTSLRTLLAATGNRQKRRIPEAVDYDKPNDFIGRTSDLAGNANGKTATFSVFLYREGGNNEWIYGVRKSGIFQRIEFYCNLRSFQLDASDTGGTKILSMRGANDLLPAQTWCHLLISFDLSNSSKRWVRINRDDVTSNVTFPTYTNADIEFTGEEHTIAARPTPDNHFEGRLGHFFLDYEYRENTTETLDLFVTPDLEPVDATDLNGIIYCKMDDETNPGKNDGTGGDFSLTGVVAKSGRGPNQYNVFMSDLNGSTDYTRRTSTLSGATVGKQFTFNGNMRADAFNDLPLFAIGEGTDYFTVRPVTGNPAKLRVIGLNSAASTVLDMETTESVFVLNKSHSVQVSGDMTDSSTLAIVVDGESQAITINTAVDDNIAFNRSRQTIGNSTAYNKYFDGALGDIWFHTELVDLKTRNPFWAGGKPASLGADGSSATGNVPLVYCPMFAWDAGLNKGSGGDFVEFGSAPYTGARGTSEFWSGCAKLVASSNQYLRRSSGLENVQNGKQFTIVVGVNGASAQTNKGLFSIYNGTHRLLDVLAYVQTTSRVDVICDTDGGSAILNVQTANGSTLNNTDRWYMLLMSFDMTDVNKRHIYSYEGLSNRQFDDIGSGATWTTYNDTALTVEGYDTRIGLAQSGDDFDGSIGFFWYAMKYIDFSQEANLLKFVDCYGYPVDQGSTGRDGTGIRPSVYMYKDVHAGANAGNGGDFVPQNGPTDGGSVRG